MAKRPFRIEGGVVASGVQQLDSASVLQAISVGLDSVAVSGSIFTLSDIGVSSGASMTQHHVLRWNASQGKFISDVDSDTLLTGLTNTSNTVLGTQAGQSGSDNVAIGQSTLSSSTGSSNVALGDTAGSALVSGDQNVIIGNIDGSSIEGKDGQMLMANGAGTLIMSSDSAQKVSMAAAMDVAGVLTFGSTTETTDKISEGSNNLYYTVDRFNSEFANRTTDSLSEGSDLYYTQERFNSAFALENTDSLSEGSVDQYFTDARVNANFASRTTDSLSEGSDLYYTQERFNSAFALENTDSLLEGSTNLYYTDARVNANFALRTTDSLSEGSVDQYYTEARVNANFALRTTDSLSEGSSNLYYTQERFDAAFALENTDSLTEGSVDQYYTEARVNANFALRTTDSLTEGSDLYYTQARFDAAFALENTDSLTEGSTNLYFTDARAQAAAATAYTGGTGFTYDSLTSIASIGQEVETTSDVKFSSAHVDGSAEINTAVATTTATTQIAIDTFPIATFRSGTYTITVTQGTDYQSTEMLVVHDDTSAYMVEFGTLVTGSDLADFEVSVNGSNVEILATPASANSTEFKVVRQLVGENTLAASGSGGGGGAGGDAGGGGSSYSLSSSLDTSQEMHLDPADYDAVNNSWTNSISANNAIVYAPSGTVTTVTNADGDVIGFDTSSGGLEKTVQQRENTAQLNLGSFNGNSTSSYVISYWYKDDRGGSSSNTATGHVSHMHDPYVYQKIVSGKFLWQPYAGGWTTDAGCPQTTSTTLSDGDWHHILIAYDNGTVTFYVDGVFDSTHSNGAYYLSSNGDRYLAMDHLSENSSNVGTDGCVGAVRLFSADPSSLVTADFVSVYNVDAEKYGLTPIS